MDLSSDTFYIDKNIFTEELIICTLCVKDEEVEDYDNDDDDTQLYF